MVGSKEMAKRFIVGDPYSRTMYRMLATATAKRSRVTLLASVMVMLLCIPVLLTLSIETRIERFAPDDEVRDAWYRSEELFGEDTTPYFMVVRSDTSQFGHDTILILRDLQSTLENHSGVVSVLGLPTLVDLALEDMYNTTLDDASHDQIEDVAFAIQTEMENPVHLEDRNLTLSERRRIVWSVADIFPTLVRPEGGHRVTLMVVNLEGDEDIRRGLVEDLESTIGEWSGDHPGVTIDTTSRDLLVSDIDTLSREDLRVLGLLSLTILCIILFWVFRDPFMVILPLFQIALALALTFTVLIICGIEGSVLTIAVIPLVGGLGLDYFVHACRSIRSNDADGIVSGLSTIAPAITMSMVTTAVGFLSITLTDIQPLRAFGIAAALGIFFVYILTFTLVPAGLMLRTTPKGSRGGMALRIGVPVVTRSVAVIGVAILLSSAFLVGAVQVRTEFGIGDFLPEDEGALAIATDIQETFPGAKREEAMVLVEGDITNPLVLRALMDAEIRFDLVDSIVRANGTLEGVSTEKVTGIPLFIREAVSEDPGLLRFSISATGQPLDNATPADIRELLREVRNMTDPGEWNAHVSGPATGMPFPPELADHNSSAGNDRPDGSFLIRIPVLVRTTDEGEVMVKELRDLYGDLDGVDNVEWELSGIPVLTVHTTDRIGEAQVETTLVAFIVCLGFLMIMYRNPAPALLVVTPVMLACFWVLGSLTFLNVPLNVFTAMITALTIGLGIDYGVHILEGFRDGLRRDREVRENEPKTHEDGQNGDTQEDEGKSDLIPGTGDDRARPAHILAATIDWTGGALLLSALTTIGGVGILTLSRIPMISHLGAVLAVTIFFCLLITLFLLPALLFLLLYGMGGKDPLVAVERLLGTRPGRP